MSCEVVDEDEGSSWCPPSHFPMPCEVDVELVPVVPMVDVVDLSGEDQVSCEADDEDEGSSCPPDQPESHIP